MGFENLASVVSEIFTHLYTPVLKIFLQPIFSLHYSDSIHILQYVMLEHSNSTYQSYSSINSSLLLIL